MAPARNPPTPSAFAPRARPNTVLTNTQPCVAVLKGPASLCSVCVHNNTKVTSRHRSRGLPSNGPWTLLHTSSCRHQHQKLTKHQTNFWHVIVDACPQQLVSAAVSHSCIEKPTATTRRIKSLKTQLRIAMLTFSILKLGRSSVKN